MDQKTITLTAPSGYNYTIREENGADEEILSNQSLINGGMNINNFMSAIIVSSSIKSGPFTPKEVMDLPSLDRYYILLASRMFSLGDEVEFTYNWPNLDGSVRPVNYVQDLKELIFKDYSQPPTQEEIDSKPDALPYYTDREILQTIQFKNYEVTLSSGKKIRFDFLNGNSEHFVMKLPSDKQTRNSDLLARRLQLEVNGKWDLVQEFSLFSRKEIAELRQIVTRLDPTWWGMVEVENPSTHEKTKFPIFTAPRFFYLTEA